MSAVNYAEVLKKAVECGGMELLTVRQLLQNFAIVIFPLDSRQAAETARIWPLVDGRSDCLLPIGHPPGSRYSSCGISADG